MDRAKRIACHLRPQPTAASSDDDIVICAAYRTAITKARKGGFKDTTPDALLAAVLKATIEKSSVDPAKLGDVVVGNVLQGGAGALTSRMAGFLAGIPEDVPLNAVNRQCSSGLQAVANVAAAIKAGYYDIGMAAGVESMTTNTMMDSVPKEMNPAVFENDKAQECLIPMGNTSENVAAKFGITREQQDQLAVSSHAKAVQAQKNGWFDAEIIPVTTVFTDKDGEEKEITVTKDDGVRPSTTMETLAKMAPAFDENGTTTAGNSSQVSDGAAAVLVASRRAAKKNGLPIIGTFKAFSVVGCPPDIMGIGPAVAIPAVLEQAGKTIADVDIFEINEAFASQATYCVEHLKVPKEKLNPKGGAIAFGHPLGCTGARMVSTLLHELKRTGKKSGVISMCIGTGMGAAAYVEAE
jgi:acetyl-CoA acyltransferase 1